MALRLVLKGLHTGYPTLSTNPELDVNSYGNKEENYPYIYKLSGYSVDCYDEKMRKYAAVSSSKKKVYFISSMVFVDFLECSFSSSLFKFENRFLWLHEITTTILQENQKRADE